MLYLNTRTSNKSNGRMWKSVLAISTTAPIRNKPAPCHLILYKKAYAAYRPFHTLNAVSLSSDQLIKETMCSKQQERCHAAVTCSVGLTN